MEMSNGPENFQKSPRPHSVTPDESWKQFFTKSFGDSRREGQDEHFIEFPTLGEEASEMNFQNELPKLVEQDIIDINNAEIILLDDLNNAELAELLKALENPADVAKEKEKAELDGMMRELLDSWNSDWDSYVKLDEPLDLFPPEVLEAKCADTDDDYWYGKDQRTYVSARKTGSSLPDENVFKKPATIVPTVEPKAEKTDESPNHVSEQTGSSKSGQTSIAEKGEPQPQTPVHNLRKRKVKPEIAENPPKLVSEENKKKRKGKSKGSDDATKVSEKAGSSKSGQTSIAEQIEGEPKPQTPVHNLRKRKAKPADAENPPKAVCEENKQKRKGKSKNSDDATKVPPPQMPKRGRPKTKKTPAARGNAKFAGLIDFPCPIERDIDALNEVPRVIYSVSVRQFKQKYPFTNCTNSTPTIQGTSNDKAPVGVVFSVPPAQATVPNQTISVRDSKESFVDSIIKSTVKNIEDPTIVKVITTKQTRNFLIVPSCRLKEATKAYNVIKSARRRPVQKENVAQFSAPFLTKFTKRNEEKTRC